VGGFVKGDVVVVTFPFSDLSTTKRRPAFVIANVSDNELILAQITSRAFFDSYSVKIEPNDFESGGLRTQSNIRANKLFTAETSIIMYRAGKLKIEKTTETVKTIINMLTQDE